jgi:hypothetical protein
MKQNTISRDLTIALVLLQETQTLSILFVRVCFFLVFLERGLVGVGELENERVWVWGLKFNPSFKN